MHTTPTGSSTLSCLCLPFPPSLPPLDLPFPPLASSPPSFPPSIHARELGVIIVHLFSPPIRTSKFAHCIIFHNKACSPSSSPSYTPSSSLSTHRLATRDYRKYSMSLRRHHHFSTSHRQLVDTITTYIYNTNVVPSYDTTQSDGARFFYNDKLLRRSDDSRDRSGTKIHMCITIHALYQFYGRVP